MHMLRDEARELARRIAEGCAGLKGREVMLAPTYTALDVVRETVGDHPVAVGAQDLYWEETGAFTGEISGQMLTDAGCTYAIIGHSERRQYFGETDYTVAKKVRAAYDASLAPILCVGESLEQRREGRSLDVVETQIRHGLVEFPNDGLSRLVVAYEPIWAIGTGETATPIEAEEVHAHIRSVLTDAFDAAGAESVRILYGGSVKPGNIDELMACPNVDGALVGGASLTAEDFLRIIHFEES